jgi:hypothetical protein
MLDSMIVALSVFATMEVRIVGEIRLIDKAAVGVGSYRRMLRQVLSTTVNSKTGCSLINICSSYNLFFIRIYLNTVVVHTHRKIVSCPIAHDGIPFSGH